MFLDDRKPYPILVNQSKDKEWKGALEFQDYLQWTPKLKKHFGQNVMNFRPRFLNIPALDLKKEGSQDLTSYLALYILQHIWKLDKEKVREFFVLSQGMSLEDKKFLISKVVAYIQEYDSNFSWNILQEIEEETIPEKEGRVMSLFQHTVDEACKKSHIKGRQEGIQEGMQQGMQQERQQVVLNMLKKQADMAFIAEVTGLSEEEIKKLK